MRQVVRALNTKKINKHVKTAKNTKAKSKIDQMESVITTIKNKIRNSSLAITKANKNNSTLM